MLTESAVMEISLEGTVSGKNPDRVTCRVHPIALQSFPNLGKIALAARPLSELSNHWSHRLYRVSFRWYLSMVENPAIKESASSGFPFVTKYFAARNTAV